MMRCGKCGRQTCVTHRCVWHEGRTCDDYNADERVLEEMAQLQALNKRLKTVVWCPWCGDCVEQNDGCDHMTCFCGHEFCWRCLVPYGGPDGIWKVGNLAHDPSCKFHM